MWLLHRYSVECGCFIGIARNEERGQEAVKSLQSKGLNPLFHKLDLDDVNSPTQLASFIREKHGGLDILINNAGIAYEVIF